MKTDSVSIVRLTQEKDRFCCPLNPNNIQKLINDPSSIQWKVKWEKRIPLLPWLRTWLHGIFAGGQFIFETSMPQDTNNPQNEKEVVAARTLFQLDGDMLVKIDKNILSRTDGIKIIEAHLNWTNWCFEQMRVPPWLTGRLWVFFSPITNVISRVFFNLLVRQAWRSSRK